MEVIYETTTASKKMEFRDHDMVSMGSWTFIQVELKLSAHSKSKKFTFREREFKGTRQERKKKKKTHLGVYLT